MDIYTLDRGFIKQDLIDDFESALWTERFAGDGDFQLSVPATGDMLAKLPKGQLMFCEGSDQPMILETRNIKDDILKTTGVTLTQWLNNRIIRTSADHAVKEWKILSEIPVGALTDIVQQMCVSGPYLDGTTPIGIPVSQTSQFSIPGLVVATPDGGFGGPTLDFSVPFGPVYDALKDIATTYNVGMKIIIDFADDTGYEISFHAYAGTDRTSDQSDYPVIRFSPDMDSFTDVEDLESVTDHRNYIYIFASGVDPALITGAGSAIAAPPAPAGFDLRVFQGFADNISSDGIDSTQVMSILNQQAVSELINHRVVQLVNGQIIEVEDIKYGVNFFLGDVVEVQGNTGILQTARITEYIRSQDSSGERAYPTLAMTG